MRLARLIHTTTSDPHRRFASVSEAYWPSVGGIGGGGRPAGVVFFGAGCGWARSAAGVAMSRASVSRKILFTAILPMLADDVNSVRAGKFHQDVDSGAIPPSRIVSLGVWSGLGHFDRPPSSGPGGMLV